MIRKAVSADIEQIAKTYEALLIYEKNNSSNSNWQSGIYPTIGIPIEKVPEGSMYVLEEQGEICASMVLNQEQPIEYQQINWQYSAKAEEVIVIHTLCIPPQKAGKGYGNQMVQFAIEKAKKLCRKVIRIDTWAGNKPAAALYQKNGFHFAGTAHVVLQGLIPEEQIFFELVLEEGKNE